MMPRRFTLTGAALFLLSAFCNRNVGGNLVHSATTQTDGQPCVNDLECDSFSCEDSVCVPPAPGLVEIDGDCTGAPCVANATCEDGICVEINDSCIPSDAAGELEPCGEDSDCCSGHCSTACRSATCGDDGAPCTTWQDCCDSNCDTGTGRCSSTCQVSLNTCQQGSDCCSGVCSSTYFCQ
jgi:hypothetical protein